MRITPELGIDAAGRIQEAGTKMFRGNPSITQTHPRLCDKGYSDHLTLCLFTHLASHKLLSPALKRCLEYAKEMKLCTQEYSLGICWLTLGVSYKDTYLLPPPSFYSLVSFSLGNHPHHSGCLPLNASLTSLLSKICMPHNWTWMFYEHLDATWPKKNSLISPDILHLPSLYQVKKSVQAKECRFILYSFLLSTLKAKKPRAAISTLLIYICHSFQQTSPSFIYPIFIESLFYARLFSRWFTIQ